MGKRRRFSVANFFYLRKKLKLSCLDLAENTPATLVEISDFEGKKMWLNENIKCAIKWMEGLRDERA